VELLYVVAGRDWCISARVLFPCNGSFTVRVRVGCLIAPLENAAEALWKVFGRQGKKKK